MRPTLALSLLVCASAAPLAAQASEPLTAGHGAERPAVETRWQLPELGLSVKDVRAVGPDGRVARSTRLADGTPVDVDALRREDHALAHERRGHLSRDLFQALADLPAGDTLEVAFWLHQPDGRDLGAERRARLQARLEARLQAPLVDQPAEQVGDAVRASRLATLQAAIERHAPDNAAFADAVTAAGGEVVLVADAWPLVVARVGADAARGLALHPLVDEADRSMPAWFDEGDFAQGTLRSPDVWQQGVSADGSVRVLVNDTAQVMTTNPYLPPITTLNTSSTGSHATSVAGNIANNHPTYRASNYSIPTLYSAGGSGDSLAPPIWSTAIANGVDFGNCSWWNSLKGSIASLDRFFDYTIREFGVMMFKSTGNQGTTTEPYTTTPGNGYNMVCSGAYSDNDDLGWAGDAMASSSSYWDPIEGHEKPEVASPGTCVTTTGTDASFLQTCFGGTSSASPLTTGVAALIAAGDNTLLSQMTTVKAVLMASAWHNVEGDPVLSEFDGAGGVHAGAAWNLVRDHQWWYDDVVAGDFSGGVLDVAMDLAAGDETRVVALWFSKANSAYTTDVLQMDLDMTVLAPDQSVVASSVNAFNPFEIAAFVAPATGSYTVRLTRQRFDGTSEPLTVAWSTRRDAAQASIALAPGSQPFARNSAPTMLFREPYEGAGKTYVTWASLGGPPGVVMGSGYTQLIGFDFFSEYVLSLPGFFGTLDANGQATAQVFIPNVLEAIGVPIHFGMIVVGPLVDLSTIATVADDTVFVIQP